MKIYLVGGAVRDKLLGLDPKDLDYTVEAESFQAMREGILALGGKIFNETEKFLTIRARVPSLSTTGVDFVLARKDGVYSDGRHPDTVIPGNLFDDLARRDFTVNAMAEDTDTGELIDPHDGQNDLRYGVLTCVGDTESRFLEDALRMLRAVRFHVTRGLLLSYQIRNALENVDLLRRLAKVSRERAYEEMKKMFLHSTKDTIHALNQFPYLASVLYEDLGINLVPSLV